MASPSTVGIRRDNHFFDLAFRDAVHQTLDLQLLRPDAAQRRQRSAQHVIETVELPRHFDAHDIVRLLHHADDLPVAPGVAAILAQFGIADVIADRADAQLVFNVENGLREVLGIVAAGAHYVKRDALRGLLADARQALELGDQPGQRLREIGHGLEQPRRQAQAAQHPAHFLLRFFVHFLDRVVGRRQHQVLQHLHVAGDFGSIFTPSTFLWPSILIVTMPPPAVPSTRICATSACSFSCIFCACCIMACMFPGIFIRSRAPSGCGRCALRRRTVRENAVLPDARARAQ